MGGPERGHPVTLEAVTKVFHGHLGLGRTVAVDRLTFRVEPGEIFGLVGPNGAGKTTTLKMILALTRPDGGVIRLLGLPPSHPDARVRVGFLPENPYFHEYLTAAEFLDLYGRLKGMAPRDRSRAVREQLGRVGLAGRERTVLRKFSKGMIQRVGLAQAVLNDPDLLILDEPMSGLDPVGRREVRDLILSFRAAGKTVVFSSHILQDAELICDRVAILRGGRLRSLGRLDRLMAREVQWYEVAVDGEVPDSAEVETLARTGSERLIRVRDVGALARVLASVTAAGGRVLSVWPYRETLEDVFLREIGREDEKDRPHG